MKMKTAREIVGKPGRMCDVRGGGDTEREKKGGGGGNEKEVISGLFLPAFCQPPSEIFRQETHTKGAFLNRQRTMRDWSTCLPAYLTVCEAHKW